MSPHTLTITLTDFLTALHPQDSEGFIDLRALPSKAQAFIRPGDIEAAERFIRAHADENLYFGPATRKTRDSGKLENCGTLSVLFIDIDFKDISEAKARVLIERFPYKPSIIIHSGGGLHIYWLLREPLDLQAPEDCTRAKNLLRRLALALGGDLSSAEPARVLRIPRTLNHKPEYGTPRPVLIETFNPERAYNPSDFDDVLPAEPEPKANENGRGFTVGKKIKDHERNATLYRLARSLKAKGLSEAAILAAVRVENETKCDSPMGSKLGDEKVEDIVSNAMRQPDRVEFTANRRESAPDVVIICLADVRPEPVTWLWPGRIPMGKITLIDGDPGLGKSTLAFDLAARVSTGSVMPDGSPSLPGGAVILTLEDGLADTVVPRLKVAGADLEKIVALQGVKSADGKLRVPTVEDVAALTSACQQVAAKIVIIDPLMAYLPSQRNSWRDQDVRQALAPLAKMAEEIGGAVVVIRHLNKSGGSQSIYRGGGSIGIIGAARSALLVAKDPENEDRRVLAAIKTNLTRMPESLSFRMATIDETARIVWEGTSSHTADALLAVPVSQEERSVLEDAADFLRSILEKGPVEVKQIQKAARQAGIVDATLRRAKSYAGVTSKRDKFGEGGKWFWSLDAQEVSKVLIQNSEHLREEMSILGEFEEV